MVTQLQPDVRAYLHGGEVIKRYIRVEEVAHEYGFSVEETEYIAKAAGSLYKLTRIHLVKKERFDEFMKHIYKVPGTNKQIIKKFARIGEASIIYSIQNIMRYGRSDIDDEYFAIIKAEIEDFVDKVYNSIREFGYNLKTTPIVFVGGGAVVMKNFGSHDAKNISYNLDVHYR